jgi:Domain of unknown function (DUF4382)
MRLKSTSNTPLTLCLAAAAGAALVAACGGGGGSNDATGTMRLALTDAPACGYDRVWVTVEKVRVHKSGSADDTDNGWSEVALATPQRIDLLEYTNGATLPLGQTQLPAGTYTQMRLVLSANGNSAPYANAIDPTGDEPETALDTPSGQQSGLKFNVNMTVPENQVADFVLDFDACRSFVRAGNSGKFLLKPVIRVIPVLSDAGQRIVGYVDQDLANGDTLVSAQQGGVVIKSTPPDADGRFVLYPVPEGTYDLVITAPGRANAVMTGVPVVLSSITTVGSDSARLDPPLSDVSYAATGTIAMSPATASIDAAMRALQAVAGGPTIEAAAVRADATSGAYRVTLPTAAPAAVAYAASAGVFRYASAASGAGAYTIEAKAGGATQTAPIMLTNTAVVTDFVFP